MIFESDAHMKSYQYTKMNAAQKHKRSLHRAPIVSNYAPRNLQFSIPSVDFSILVRGGGVLVLCTCKSLAEALREDNELPFFSVNCFHAPVTQ
jgi:hypothetical protein